MIDLRALLPYAAPPRPTAATRIRCELCTLPLGDDHAHIVELGTRGVLCACRACAILFTSTEATAPRYRTVPRRVLRDRELGLTAAAWAELGIPVGLAFCVRHTDPPRAVVCYPGPAGIVDAELDPGVWDTIAAATSLAAELVPEVEALLIRGERGSSTLACYLVPITAAYELVARLRRSWRGFTGGDEAIREIAELFGRLDLQSATRQGGS
jgi:hypothetical protein